VTEGHIHQNHPFGLKRGDDCEPSAVSVSCPGHEFFGVELGYLVGGQLFSI
jgi:hypothetical protein